MSSVCIRSGDTARAQRYIDEAMIDMEDISCVPGINYTLYKLALLRYMPLILLPYPAIVNINVRSKGVSSSVAKFVGRPVLPCNVFHS